MGLVHESIDEKPLVFSFNLLFVSCLKLKFISFSFWYQFWNLIISLIKNLKPFMKLMYQIFNSIDQKNKCPKDEKSYFTGK